MSAKEPFGGTLGIPASAGPVGVEGRLPSADVLGAEIEFVDRPDLALFGAP